MPRFWLTDIASPKGIGDGAKLYCATSVGSCGQHVAKIPFLKSERAGFLDVLQLSGRLAGGLKESRNGNPTRDLQMSADRARPHTLCGPVVSSLFSVAARC